VPSTPRSAVWRKLKRLGAAQLVDGLVTLPADARTREALEWIAQEVIEYGGEAVLWLGRPADERAIRVIRERMADAVNGEYAAVSAGAAEAAVADSTTRRRVLARLRRELHRIDSRNFFGGDERDRARLAVDELGHATTSPVVQP